MGRESRQRAEGGGQGAENLPAAGRRPPARCVHLGQPDPDRTIKVRCVLIGSRRPTIKVFRVHGCALHGECLPGYACHPSAIIEAVESGDGGSLGSSRLPRTCHGCGDKVQS